MLGLAEQVCSCNISITSNARTFRLHHPLSPLPVSCKVVHDQRVHGYMVERLLTTEYHAQNRSVQSSSSSGLASFR